MSDSRLKIAKVIAERTLNSGYDQKQLAKEVAAYLLDTGRTQELDSLVRDIIDYRAKAGYLEVSLISAHELSDQLIKEVDDLIETIKPGMKSTVLDKQLDKTLLGGVKLGLANEQLDLTLRSKLNRFKQMTNLGKA